MNRKLIIVGSIAVVIAIGAVALMGERKSYQTPVVHTPVTAGPETPPPPSAHSSMPAVAAERVPAHYEAPPSASSLGATLSPDKFIGKTKEAYQIAREIPQTLAQLPCYCHCDEGFGHKSLHSCFEDDHAASCAVCTEEALLAYQLQKELKLTPAQIRQRIIAGYGKL